MRERFHAGQKRRASPEEFVEKAEPGFGVLALEHNQLPPERQIF